MSVSSPADGRKPMADGRDPFPACEKRIDDLRAFVFCGVGAEAAHSHAHERRCGEIERQRGQPRRFRVEGGKFFDANMKAQVNNAVGVRVFTEMRNENRFMPPGVEKFGFVENLAVFLKGESAMTISWPPYGRFAAGYLANEKALDWVPKSTVAGKVGYTLPPGGHPELAAGFALCNARVVVPKSNSLQSGDLDLSFNPSVP